ncbi:MAG TPA: tetratricopeptide repeat protein [Terriglobales bacterium]|nr:tetratricopeptide repeat protein [Terriglobales bacterium]
MPAPVARQEAITWQCNWAVPTAVVLVTALALIPLLQNQFVNWDDRVNLLENRYYRGLSWTHLQWMFTTFHNSLYRPLTWITLGADYLIWGMDAPGYHFTSLILHCAAAFSFYVLTCEVLPLVAPTLARPKDPAVRIAAGFAALLFAIHPLRVEPVAWASGRENVVAGPFFILTLVCYLRAVDRAASIAAYWKWMVTAWLAFALSLLGKGAGVTLPIALLILDIYPLGRFQIAGETWFGLRAWRILWEKAPFFILALIAGLLAIYGKQQSKLMYGLAQYGLADRAVQTVYGLGFYLWKTLLPLDLSPLYEMEALSPSEARFLLSAALLLTITIAFWLLRRRWPWGLASWAYYIVVLLPYIGVAQNGPQVAADRYSYLACLPWPIIAGVGLLYCWRARQQNRLSAPVFRSIQASSVCVLVLFSFLTWRQAQVWRDSETLWRHALVINEKSFFAHHFLGSALLVKGKTEAAVEQFRRSLTLNPGYASAHAGLASALAEHGELDQSVEEYQKALALDPDSLETHYSLGRVLTKRGEADAAIIQYQQALGINPDDPDTHNNLGLLLFKRGNVDKALEHFEMALRGDPSYAKAHFNLGRLYVQQGRLDDAVKHFERALQLQPGVAEIHESLGRALALQGKKQEAAGHLAEAVRILKRQRPAS